MRECACPSELDKPLRVSLLSYYTNIPGIFIQMNIIQILVEVKGFTFMLILYLLAKLFK